MKDVMVAVIEKFNESQGASNVRFIESDASSCRIAIEQDMLPAFIDFLMKSTHSKATGEVCVDISGASMARLFFEKPIAAAAIDCLRAYEDGAPPRAVETCQDC